MEQKNESVISEHPNSPIDEETHDNEETVARPSSSSSVSSSSSFLSLNQSDADTGENDNTFPESTQAGVETLTDSNTLHASPIQSPPIQVMGYDQNRVPSSKFPRKRRNDSEWSLASNDSLFSIHMGSDSFSMDNGYIISKSGKLNWNDDGLEYSPGLSTVMDTSAENEQNSEEKDEFLEIQNDVEKENEWDGSHSFSTDSSVPNGKGANIACLSDASSHRNSSFAFPVLAGGGSPVKVQSEKPQSPPLKPPAEAQTTSKNPSATPKTGGNQWFPCFSCFPLCS